jgi:hypothetical protein
MNMPWSRLLAERSAQRNTAIPGSMSNPGPNPGKAAAERRPPTRARSSAITSTRYPGLGISIGDGEDAVKF